MRYPKPFQNLIAHFSALPSVGPKMAERIVLHLFKQEHERLLSFAESLEALQDLSLCTRCFHIAEGPLCDVCSDPKRDPSVLCVVEEPMDVIAIERSGGYQGLYHVLGGVMRTGQGDDPSLRIPELLSRIATEDVKEVILALNPTTEGDLTTLYLRKKLEPLGVTVSRPARGLSTGGDIEYADEATLTSALRNREKLG
ncbi:MAG: recombination protein RecR [Candidatus Moranbacteria bacterium]|nr:recombination protein RecR [Candidatus Moranbacteria bacterium]NTW45595.1 recombination protein RecR [Candidatus Moranbacteria bacterium]